MIKRDQRKIRYSSKDLILTATFGTLWGFIEITLGNFLKGLKIPLGGAMMGSVSVLICLTGYYFIRQKGAILIMGCIAGLVKIFSIGMVLFSPSIAIIIEALIAETMIRLCGISIFSYILTGIAVVIYTMIHPLLLQGIVFGTDIYSLYLKTLQKAADITGITQTHALWIVIILLVVHSMLGLFSGMFAHQIGTAVSRQLKSNEE